MEKTSLEELASREKTVEKAEARDYKAYYENLFQ